MPFNFISWFFKAATYNHSLFVFISFTSGLFYIDDCESDYTPFRTKFLNKTTAEVGTCMDLLGLDSNSNDTFLLDECELAYGVPVDYYSRPTMEYCVQDDFTSTVVFQVDLCCGGE